MRSGRCAACKYLRRRCTSNCIFSPHFPSNKPQRFASVHKIYGASNVAKMLQRVPETQRPETANSLYYEAECRIEDPVYGSAGIISLLNRQINDMESQLAKSQAEIAILMISNQGRENELEENMFSGQLFLQEPANVATNFGTWSTQQHASSSSFI